MTWTPLLGPPEVLRLCCLLLLGWGITGTILPAARPGRIQAEEKAASATPPFDRARLLELAQKLSEAEFREPDKVTGWLAKLGYDEYRRIRFRPEMRIWREEKLGYQMDLLHVGGIYAAPIEISILNAGGLTPLEFGKAQFEYDGMLEQKGELSGTGYSGFRLRYPLLAPEDTDEFLVFQGASYFRAVARGQSYGVSGRGLAIRTGAPEGEEFPAFRRFWIERPDPYALTIRVHALLDSPSVTGAYTFVASPGAETILDVELRLFPRRDVKSYGIAPLTSMFMFSTRNRANFDDYRSAVHDSDGLQMITGKGARLWRPLLNPRNLEMSAFADNEPKGFGLVQRHRDFEDFSDLEARYERRPSTWIEPLGPWGKGAVVLVEIPAKEEFHDNIVAFWQPAEPLKAGEPRSWSYRLRFTSDVPDSKKVARIVETRTGESLNGEHRLLVVDFAATKTMRRADEILVDAGASEGSIKSNRLETLPDGGRRVTLEFAPGDAKSSEFRVHLVADGERCSETWLYRWTR